jgi:hypothetical protein
VDQHERALGIRADRDGSDDSADVNGATGESKAGDFSQHRQREYAGF